ncbi:SMI1 / KNR4 family protein [Streptomyces sp. YIM 121038]|uniref:SMI1/KNR4 family protein n=1 Tax=Streptomyces sp. YIM 121038 TaxID=2136401 RepID=UPI00111042A4|nr:SMI1/KNR4 family protein [Streptomyces sp. YIM 121038]QCX78884.1 SMI1 / KNR4 family protein [Streptomyces sp. YIM 121038]
MIGLRGAAVGGVWAGVRERVLAVREAPHWREVFGADWLGEHGHGFRLEPVLSEPEVRAVEHHLGVELPGEYRDFLRQVGAGGAGPDYGLFAQRPPGSDDEPDSGACALPFRPEGTDELAGHEADQPCADDYADEEALSRDYAAWEARYDVLHDSLTDGTLHLGHQGCGYYTLLAVTGPERGTLWDDVRAVGEGVQPVTRQDKPRVTFAQWYLSWLEHAERTAAEGRPRPYGT